MRLYSSIKIFNALTDSTITSSYQVSQIASAGCLHFMQFSDYYEVIHFGKVERVREHYQRWWGGNHKAQLETKERRVKLLALMQKLSSIKHFQARGHLQAIILCEVNHTCTTPVSIPHTTRCANIPWLRMHEPWSRYTVKTRKTNHSSPSIIHIDHSCRNEKPKGHCILHWCAYPSTCRSST